MTYTVKYTQYSMSDNFAALSGRMDRVRETTVEADSPEEAIAAATLKLCGTGVVTNIKGAVPAVLEDVTC